MEVSKSQTFSDEFSHVRGITYLDHIGATLYSRSQIEAHKNDLLSNLYSNTHSGSISGLQTSNVVDQVRERILQHFLTSSDHYSVIFTSGCTSALKLLAECFNYLPPSDSAGQHDAENGSQLGLRQNDNGEDRNQSNSFSNHENFHCNESTNVVNASDGASGEVWMCNLCGKPRRGVFLYTQDTHTSVLGIREIAATKGASVYYVPYREFVTVSSKIESEKFTVDCKEIDTTDLTMLNDGGDSCCNGETSDEIKTRSNESSRCRKSSLKSGSDREKINMKVVPLEDISAKMSCTCRGGNNGLFVYPALSNFNGQKYSLEFSRLLADRRIQIDRVPPVKQWFVAMDAASFVSTNRLSLSEFKPDFVTMSFYKIFGFPTGLGALLVRNEIANKVLNKTYFGGGTVLVSLATERFHVNRNMKIHERFEDGTLPFLDIVALKHGFDALERIGGTMEDISSRVFKLSKFVYEKLSSMQHPNGEPVIKLYHFDGAKFDGNVVTFNVLSDDGGYFGYSMVNKLAQLYNIHLRTGCFCNIGACQYYMELTSEEIKSNYQAGHVCGDDIDLIDGRPTGAVRISFGYSSTMEDALNFISFIEKCFIHKKCSVNHLERIIKDQITNEIEPKTEQQKIFHNLPAADLMKPTDGSEPWIDLSDSYQSVVDSCQSSLIISDDKSTDNNVLTNLILYPVKSCAGFQVSSWEIGDRGLLYDRQWMIVNNAGVCLSQKRAPNLCLIRPFIDIEQQILVLMKSGMPNLCVPICQRINASKDVHAMTLCRAKVCGDGVNGIDLGDTAAQWISTAIGQSACRLIQQHNKDLRSTRIDNGYLSLANQSQFLLISELSGQVLLDTMSQDCSGTKDLSNLLHRFRANLIVSGGKTPFAEEDWSDIRIGSHQFHNEGRCNRCQMICIDQLSAERNETPLLALSKIHDNKMKFGIYLKHVGCGNELKTVKLKVGDRVYV